VTHRGRNASPEDAPDPFTGPALDAERSILGAMLIGIEVAREARTLIQPRHFHRVEHRLAFEAMLAQVERDEEPSLISLSAELERRGELERCGGIAGLALLLEFGATAKNLGIHVTLVRERAVRASARDLGRSLTDAAQDVTVPIDEAIRAHRQKLRQAIEESQGSQRMAWMEQILTLKDVLETEFPLIESIIGNGLLTKGSYALFAGHSGLGKTYLTIQLMSQILKGGDWFGQKANPCRVGLLEFEMPWQSIKARAMKLGPELEPFGLGADVLCMPKGRWYLDDGEVREKIIDWCRERTLGLLVIDPLNRVRRGDANDEEVAAELLDSVHEITERTGTCVMLVSHVRKVPAAGTSGGRTSSATLDSIKGPSRYVDDADTVFLIDEVLDAGERLIRFEWAKTRFGEKLPPVYLRRLATGFFEQIRSPTVKRAESDDQLAIALRAAWTAGMRREDAEIILNVAPEAARRALARIHAVPRGPTKGRRFFHPDCLGELDPEMSFGEES
jgi:RecA-family ATPase